MERLMFSCPKCGSELHVGDAQCPGCGVSINTSAYAAARESYTPSQASASVATSQPAQTPAPAPQSESPSTSQFSAASTSPSSAAPGAERASQVLSDTAQQAAAQFNNVMSSKEVAAAKDKANHFFSWLLASWKHPTQQRVVPKWYGPISFALQAVIISLMGLVSSSHFISHQQNYQAYLAPKYQGMAAYGSSVVNNLTFDIMFKLLFVTLICEFIFIAFAYLGYKLTHTKQLGLLDFITRVAQYASINFLFACIAFVLNLVSLGIVGSILLAFTGPILFIAAIIAMAEHADQNGKDVMHVAFLPVFGAALSGIIYFIAVISIFIGAIGSAVSSFSHLF